MDVKLLPTNSTCLADANILLYHIAGTSADSKGFLQRVANEEVQAYLTETQHPAEKRRLLDFVCSNSTWKDQTLTATFRQPFNILAVTNTAWQREKAAGARSSDLRPFWLRR